MFNQYVKGRTPVKKNICIVAGIAAVLLAADPAGAHAEGRMRSRGWGGGPHWGWRGSYWAWGSPYWVWGGPYWAWNGGYLVIDARPGFIVLPGYGFSVSVGTPYDMIYYDNFYNIYNNKLWYSSPACRGPWVIIEEDNVPDIIRKHNIDDIRKARDLESHPDGNQDNRGHHTDMNSSNNLNDAHHDSRSTDNNQTR